jgi:ferredoxin-NADP reductase
MDTHLYTLTVAEVISETPEAKSFRFDVPEPLRGRLRVQARPAPDFACGH